MSSCPSPLRRRDFWSFGQGTINMSGHAYVLFPNAFLEISNFWQTHRNVMKLGGWNLHMIWYVLKIIQCTHCFSSSALAAAEASTAAAAANWVGSFSSWFSVFSSDGLSSIISSSSFVAGLLKQLKSLRDFLLLTEIWFEKDNSF